MSAAARLDEARRVLGPQPERAVALAREVLRAAPDDAQALMALGAGLRRSGDPAGALDVLVPLAAAHPGAWGVAYEIGVAHAARGQTAPAIAALTRAVALNPRSALAWHAQGDQLALAGDRVGAAAAHAKPLPGGAHDPALAQAALALFDGGPTILADRFNLHLADIAAVRLLADVGIRLGRPEAAVGLLAAALARAPDFLPARLALAVALYGLDRAQEALAEIELVLARQPDLGEALGLRAAIRVQLGDVGGAITDYAAVLAADPDQPRMWLSQGHALKIVGRQAEAVAAYRQSLALAPDLGEAWWSLANLKTWRFEPGDLDAMTGLLARGDLGLEDRAHLAFALGKALEDAARYGEAFEHYRQGNAQRRAVTPYDADAHHAFVQRTMAVFTPAFLAARVEMGCPAPDPIFVVGLPRSGSTLVEQILASHSAVEGASELADLTGIAGRLAASSPYPEGLAALGPEDFAALGETYLARTQVHRKLGRAHFIDKFPGNFLHAGLIHLILPRARIIDVRRDPVGCCLSIFKQHFAQGQAYSYDLGDLGRYHADYVALMAHFDAVLPGRIHRVSYEALVADTEAEVRRLLAYCGLPFESQCLRFYETRRAVRTASSEQVRQPIFQDGVDQWRRFEPWLGPLKAALGPCAGEGA